MIHNCLSDDEEIKLERLVSIVKFLGFKEIVHWIDYPIRFNTIDKAFYHNVDGHIMPPTQPRINGFYNRFLKEAEWKMIREAKNTKIIDINRLLLKFHNLDFMFSL